MQRLAVALLLGGVLLVASWVVAGDPPQPVNAPTAVPRPDQVAELVDDVNRQVEMLRERLELERRFSPPSRNPFSFETPKAPVVVAPPVAPIAVPEPPPLPQLVAILTDKTDAGLVRRAAISISGAVRIVKVGDAVDQFDVTRIDADGVDLKDRNAPATLRLTIR